MEVYTVFTQFSFSRSFRNEPCYLTPTAAMIVWSQTSRSEALHDTNHGQFAMDTAEARSQWQETNGGDGTAQSESRSRLRHRTCVDVKVKKQHVSRDHFHAKSFITPVDVCIFDVYR